MAVHLEDEEILGCFSGLAEHGSFHPNWVAGKSGRGELWLRFQTRNMGRMRRVDHTDAVQPHLKAVSSVAWEIQDWNRNTRGADFPDGTFKV